MCLRSVHQHDSEKGGGGEDSPISPPLDARLHSLMVPFSGASESCPGRYCGRIVEDNGKVGDCGVSFNY